MIVSIAAVPSADFLVALGDMSRSIALLPDRLKMITEEMMMSIKSMEELVLFRPMLEELLAQAERAELDRVILTTRYQKDFAKQVPKMCQQEDWKISCLASSVKYTEQILANQKTSLAWGELRRQTKEKYVGIPLRMVRSLLSCHAFIHAQYVYLSAM